MHAVAGDVGSLQPLGELVGEEHVAQFTVAVGVEELPAVPAGAQVSVRRQSLNTTHICINTGSPERRGHHSTGDKRKPAMTSSVQVLTD